LPGVARFYFSIAAMFRDCTRRRIVATFSRLDSQRSRLRKSTIGTSYDWPSAIANNGAVGKNRYKGNQAVEVQASVSVVFELPRSQNGHGRQHRSRMPRALPNPPDDVARIRKRQLRQGQSDARIYVDSSAERDGEERLCHFGIRFNVRPDRGRGTFSSSDVMSAG